MHSLNYFTELGSSQLAYFYTFYIPVCNLCQAYHPLHMLGELVMGTAEQNASWTRAEDCVFKAASTASAASKLFLQCDFDIPRIGVTENWQYVTSQARSSGGKTLSSLSFGILARHPYRPGSMSIV